jgi:hypothetical protein
MGEMRSAYRILVEEPERKRPLAKPSVEGEGDIKIDLREIRREVVDWINLAQESD